MQPAGARLLKLARGVLLLVRVILGLMNRRVLLVSLLSSGLLADLVVVESLRFGYLLLAHEAGDGAIVNPATEGLALGHTLKLLIRVGLSSFDPLLDLREGYSHL